MGNNKLKGNGKVPKILNNNDFDFQVKHSGEAIYLKIHKE